MFPYHTVLSAQVSVVLSHPHPAGNVQLAIYNTVCLDRGHPMYMTQCSEFVCKNLIIINERTNEYDGMIWFFQGLMENGKCKNLNIYICHLSIHTDDAVRWHKCHSSRAHNGRYFHPNVLVWSIAV